MTNIIFFVTAILVCAFMPSVLNPFSLPMTGHRILLSRRSHRDPGIAWLWLLRSLGELISIPVNKVLT